MHPSETTLGGDVRRHLRDHPDLLPAGGCVLVALSGGLDSTVLLHLLRFGRVADVEVRAAHFDHRMRPESSRDADWCRGLAQAWSVPFQSAASAMPIETETQGRHARYGFIAAAVRESGAHRVATAHHADDQIETVLFRLLRGSGWPGLTGIPALRTDGAFRADIARPLLPFRRSRLVRYAGEVGLRWRDDPTNRDLRYTRNRLRHSVLPALEAAAPGMRDALASLGSAAAIAETRIAPLMAAATAAATLQAGPVSQLARDVLLSYDPWVRARVMKAILGAHGVRAGRAIRTATRFILTARSGASIHLPGGLILERAFDRFLLLAPAAAVGPDRPLVLDSADGTGDARIGGQRVRLAWGRCAATDATEIDLSRARLPLTLRGWWPGDRIRLGGGSRKLKKLFGEKRLARSFRSRVPVLADAQGVVFWVPGIALAEGAGTGPGPRLRLTVRT